MSHRRKTLPSKLRRLRASSSVAMLPVLDAWLVTLSIPSARMANRRR